MTARDRRKPTPAHAAPRHLRSAPIAWTSSASSAPLPGLNGRGRARGLWPADHDRPGQAAALCRRRRPFSVSASRPPESKSADLPCHAEVERVNQSAALRQVPTTTSVLPCRAPGEGRMSAIVSSSSEFRSREPQTKCDGTIRNRAFTTVTIKREGFTAADFTDCAKRELAQRRRAYPQWVRRSAPRRCSPIARPRLCRRSRASSARNPMLRARKRVRSAAKRRRTKVEAKCLISSRNAARLYVHTSTRGVAWPARRQPHARRNDSEHKQQEQRLQQLCRVSLSLTERANPQGECCDQRGRYCRNDGH